MRMVSSDRHVTMRDPRIQPALPEGSTQVVGYRGVLGRVAYEDE
jgi:hypothetical protein